MKNLIKRILKEEEDLQWAQDAVSGEIRPTRSLILKPQANTIKNAIETHTEVMHGDGDSYDKNIVLYFKDGEGRWGKGYSNDRFNFDDFEKVVDFLKDNHQINWDDDEETEFFIDAGVIDYDEYADNGFEVGTIISVYYYDETGNRFKAKIDGITTYHDYENEDEEEDENIDMDDDEEDEEDEEVCEICGGYDDNGWGVCSDCEEEDQDDEEIELEG